jgi:hypothetical protein
VFDVEANLLRAGSAQINGTVAPATAPHAAGVLLDPRQRPRRAERRSERRASRAPRSRLLRQRSHPSARHLGAQAGEHDFCGLTGASPTTIRPRGDVVVRIHGSFNPARFGLIEAFAGRPRYGVAGSAKFGTKRESLRSAIRELEARREALVSPQSAVQREVAVLRGQIRDLEQKIESREKLRAEYSKQQEDINHEARDRRQRAKCIDNERLELEKNVEAEEREVLAAQARVVQSHVHALRVYLDSVFRFLQGSATARDALSEYDRVRAAFEAARHADPEVAKHHEERIELQELLKTARVQSVQTLLEKQLRDVEAWINARFPKLLDGPPPATDENIELFYWYDVSEEVTRLVLPLPASFWSSPPQAPQNPRGPAMCKVLWSIVRPFAESVPTADRCGDFVVLEFHGDFTSRLSDDFIEFGDGAGAGIRFLAVPLAPEVASRLEE